MASSSSSIDSYSNYDVFLSFRGGDTRNNFTSHLYKALCRNTINAFIDNKIDRGDEITPALERVIEAVKLSIIVFSFDYVSSTFCLDELVKILECKESKSQIVLPIFYKVEPSKITYQEGFAKHETIEPEMKVEKWRLAFHKALELAGWHVDDNSNEAEIIDKITEEVRRKLDSCHSKGEELISTSIIGHAAEDNFNKIWEYLMNDEISRVGVYGMGGIGKTTISTRIYNQLHAAANSFSHVYWVTVSKDSSIYKLQSAIAGVINLNFSKEDDERKRASMLRRQLIRRNFVLILDDLWEAFEIEDVGIPLLIGGGKLLLTTRSRRVCQMMKCQAIKIEHLLQPEAMELFLEESQHQINGSREWRDTMISIVRECAGLPLAIIVIARRMRGVVEIEEWRNTLRDLQRSCEGENHEMEEKVFKLLKFSYDCLPSRKCQQCFLYCSLFPEDYKFRRDDLIEYWIGEGLIDEQDSRQAMLDKGNCIVNELINASLLEYGKNFEGDNIIKMHDVIRDMARITAKVGLQFEDPLRSVQVINETLPKSFPNSTPQCSKLRTLLLRNHYYKMELLLDCFFDSMQCLTILDICRIKKIPNSLKGLKNLRVLIIFDCWYLKRLPLLCGLEKLQHLKISSTSLREMPEGMEGLVNLRVLNLTNNCYLRGSILSNVLEKLPNLQTLDLHETRVDVELEVLISLEKLETLSIDFYDLRKLNCYVKSGVKSGPRRSLVDYRIYYYPYYRYWDDMGMYGKATGNVEERKKGVLINEGCVDEEGKGESSIILPEDIEHLELQYCDSSLFRVLRNTTFADLQKILINHCGSKYLFTVDLARRLLHNVQELHICSCNGLEEIIATGEESVIQNNYRNCPTIELSNLKRLKLWGQPKLRSIYRGRMVCPSLELIQIGNCDKLERLPFCMEEDGTKQNPRIQVEGIYILSRTWWDSLQWDNPDDKSMYKLPERVHPMDIRRVISDG